MQRQREKYGLLGLKGSGFLGAWASGVGGFSRRRVLVSVNCRFRGLPLWQCLVLATSSLVSVMVSGLVLVTPLFRFPVPTQEWACRFSF